MKARIAQTVSQLPVLDQRYFPVLSALAFLNGKFFPVDTRLQRFEKEIILGVIATAAVKAGMWKPVSVGEFREIAKQGISEIFIRQVMETAWELDGEHMVDLVKFDDVDYIVPLPAFTGYLYGSAFAELVPA